MHDDQHISSDTRILAYNEVVDGKPKYEIYRQFRGNDKISYMLVVNRLLEQDGGRYLCKIYLLGVSDDSRWPSKFTSLTVQVPPTIIESATSSTVEKRQGTDVLLKCNATGAPMPNITWIRADGKALPDGRLSHRGHDFAIKHIRKDDRGTYRCVADNTVIPPANYDARLVVYFSPDSQAVQPTVGQAQNRRFSAILDCIISGMPEPTLRWYKSTDAGHVSIADNEKYQVSQLLNHGSALQEGEVWYSLKILNVQANDFTDYTCEGSNNLGTTQSVVRLYETHECQGPDCPSIGTGNAGGPVVHSLSTVLLQLYIGLIASRLLV